MQSKKVKLIVMVSFLALFFGGAAFMYFRYIHNKPKIKIIAPRTTIDPVKFDSLLQELNKHKTLNSDSLKRQ